MKQRPTLAFLSGFAIAGMLAFAFLHWMLDGSTPVHFENRSGVPLQGVTISGAGFEASLGNVGPGGTVRVRVYPAGESAIRVAFRANGQVISTPHDVYFVTPEESPGHDTWSSIRHEQRQFPLQHRHPPGAQ